MPRKAKKKAKNKTDDAEDLLKQIGSAELANKRRLPPELETLAVDIGRSYTETGRRPGRSEADDLMNMIGASTADDIGEEVGIDPAALAKRMQAEASKKQYQSQHHPERDEDG